MKIDNAVKFARSLRSLATLRYAAEERSVIFGLDLALAIVLISTTSLLNSLNSTKQFLGSKPLRVSVGGTAAPR